MIVVEALIGIGLSVIIGLVSYLSFKLGKIVGRKSVDKLKV